VSTAEEVGEALAPNWPAEAAEAATESELSLMFRWRFWQGGREVVFLLLVLVLVFSAQKLVQAPLTGVAFPN
jgi:hypothetical protein